MACCRRKTFPCSRSMILCSSMTSLCPRSCDVSQIFPRIRSDLDLPPSNLLVRKADATTQYSNALIITENVPNSQVLVKSCGFVLAFTHTWRSMLPSNLNLLVANFGLVSGDLRQNTLAGVFRLPAQTTDCRLSFVGKKDLPKRLKSKK